MNQAYLWEKLGEMIQIALRDDCIKEIILNPEGRLWFIHDRKGGFEKGTMSMEAAWTFVNALAQYEGKFLNEHTPFLDAILPFNGERINVTIPPIVAGISFNIRKRAKLVYSLKDYFEAEIVSAEQVRILTRAIQQRKNILISGSPASGKTTFANALLDTLSQVAPEGHRVLLLEQVPELQCRVSNVKSMIESDHVNMNKLLWLAMRNSPDRIVIGEVRDGAALDMLKAWNTGCPGGIATIHANSPEAAVQRVLDLACEVTPNPPYCLAVEALNIIVQIKADRKYTSGRKVTGIVELQGYETEKNEFFFKRLDSEGEDDASN